MKMEVLSRNQFQSTQFEVIGSGKIKDWTTPLTPPPPNHHHHQVHHLYQNRQQQHHVAGGNAAAAAAAADVPTITTAEDSTVAALSLRLQAELRAAKSRHLSCTEVLLPPELLERVAAEMVSMSEKEPCGIRGCSVFIEFEDEPSNSRRIASMQVDANTVSTFELYLTLRHDRRGWTSILPQFLKNLTSSWTGSTIIISSDFTLTKNKLYRSFSE